MNTKLVGAEECAAAVGIPPTKIQDLRRKKKIPCVDLGYRTKLFDIESVRAALGRLEVKTMTGKGAK